MNGKAPRSFIDFSELLAAGTGAEETLVIRRGTARKDVAASLVPGTHASTFGGNPIACAAGVAVFGAIEEGGLLENCNRLSRHAFERLGALKARHPKLIREVRGRGLMIGLELTRPGSGIFSKCLERGLRINCTHDVVLRLMPPITVTRELLDEGLSILEQVIAEQAEA